ncbi:MAG TPA: hypothetical protein ENJ95_12670 [Bacteroidetes bacterium]|nr:hypothetical protein [Bacteroidota bacterium]
MKKVLLFAFALIAASAVFAQVNPVKWSYEAKQVSGSEYDLVFTAHISDGWYVYSQFLESDEGPIATSFSWGDKNGVELIGKTAELGDKHEGFDKMFDMNILKYSGQPTFTQRVKVKPGASISGYLEYMTCDEHQCLPPTEVDFQFDFK